MDAVKLKTTGDSVIYHDQSGLVASDLNSEWVSYRQLGGDPYFYLHNIYDGREILGTRATQGQQFIGPNGGLLEIEKGVVREYLWHSDNAQVLCEFALPDPLKNEDWVKWSFVPSPRPRIERFVWTERRSPLGWLAGCVDLKTGESTALRAPSYWCPYEHETRAEPIHWRWHSMFCTGKYAWVIPQRAYSNEPGFIRRWYRHDPFSGQVGDFRGISHPAMAGDLMAWTTERLEVRTNYLRNPIIAGSRQRYNHLQIMPTSAGVLLAASREARGPQNQWVQRAVDVFLNDVVIDTVDVERHPGTEFSSYARPWVANMRDGWRCFWHSDIEGSPGKTQLYMGKIHF